MQHATQLGYQDLDRVAAKLVEAIDPDGILPADEAEHRLRRFFHLKHRKDGSWAGDFRLTPDVGQKLAALLGPLTKPQTTRFQTGADPDDDDPSQQARRRRRADPRTTPTRRLGRGPRCRPPHPGPARGRWHPDHPAADHVLGGLPQRARHRPLRRRHPRLRPHRPAARRPGRHRGLLQERQRCGPRPVADPTDRHHRPNPRVDRPRRRLLLPRLRCGTPMVRAAPCDRLVRRRQHQPRQPDPGLLLPPPPVRPTRLAMPDQHRRPPGLDPTQVDRPAATTDPERPDHHQQLGSPGPAGLHPTPGRRSTRPIRQPSD